MDTLTQSGFQKFLAQTPWPAAICDWAYTDEDQTLSYQTFADWIARHDHGPLHYLSDHRAVLRQKLSNYYPDFQSALVFLFDYGQSHFLKAGGPNLARYVTNFQGADYHLVLKDALETIGLFLKSKLPDLHYVLSLDIHPVLERDLAHRAGLGWFGKNSMLLNRQKGSMFIIASLLINKKLNFSKRTRETDHCGTCRACVQACPTQAIDEQTRTLKAERCISTFTIELFKDSPAPPGYKNKEQWIFGCDICQEVCPWNKVETLPDALTPLQEKLKHFFLDCPITETISELEGMSNKAFERQFKGTSLARTGRVGILKNLKALI